MRTLTQYHNKHVLISGQGPTEEIGRMYVIDCFENVSSILTIFRLGFKSITTVEKVCNAFPELDMVNHKNRAKLVS
jgi:hypothetical protein